MAQLTLADQETASKMIINAITNLLSNFAKKLHQSIMWMLSVYSALMPMWPKFPGVINMAPEPFHIQIEFNQGTEKPVQCSKPTLPIASSKLSELV